MHRDSVADINQVRSQNDLNATASPSNNANEQNNRARFTTASGQLNCPICIAETVLPYETNCGHIFCGNCIVQYWRHATANIFHSKM